MEGVREVWMEGWREGGMERGMKGGRDGGMKGERDEERPRKGGNFEESVMEGTRERKV